MASIISGNINLSKIKKVFSHIHALNQCKKNIRKLNISPVNFIDTAGAAKYISETKTTNSAAIASKLASEIYNLKIVKNNMQDSKNNITRFLVFSKIYLMRSEPIRIKGNTGSEKIISFEKSPK